MEDESDCPVLHPGRLSPPVPGVFAQSIEAHPTLVPLATSLALRLADRLASVERSRWLNEELLTATIHLYGRRRNEWRTAVVWNVI